MKEEKGKQKGNQQHNDRNGKKNNKKKNSEKTKEETAITANGFKKKPQRQQPPIPSGKQTKENQTVNKIIIKRSKTSFIYWVNFILFLLLLLVAGVCLYIYADGNTSYSSIKTVYPKLANNTLKLYKACIYGIHPSNITQSAQFIWKLVKNSAVQSIHFIETHSTDFKPFFSVLFDGFCIMFYLLLDCLVCVYAWITNVNNWYILKEYILTFTLYIYNSICILWEEIRKSETFKNVNDVVLDWTYFLIKEMGVTLNYLISNIPKVVENLQNMFSSYFSSTEK